MHDGGTIRLRKVHPEFDPANKIAAMNYLQERHAAGEIVTGLLYAEPDARDMHDAQETVEAPLNALADADLVPGGAALAAFNATSVSACDSAPQAARGRIAAWRRSGSILAIAGGLVLLVLIGVAIAVWTVDVNEFVAPVQAKVKTRRVASSRSVASVKLSLGLEPKVVFDDVRFGNAPWAKDKEFATVKHVEADVALLPLLKQRFEVVRLTLVEPGDLAGNRTPAAR